MRKQDYVHLHALLVVVTRFLPDGEAVSADHLAAYESLGTRPTDIHASKRRHRTAVLELADAIAGDLQQSGSVRAPGPENPPATDD